MPFSAKRFAVVGEIHQGAGDACLVSLELIDHFRDDMIGVEDRIVVGVDDLLRGATAEFGAAAIPREAAEGLRVTLVIGRTMASELVQDQHAVLLGIGEIIIDLVEQNAINAFAVGAEAGIFRLRQEGVEHPIGDIVGAGIVVEPNHADAGMAEHIVAKRLS